MMLLVLLAIGSEPEGVIGLDTEERIPFPSEWVLEWSGSRGLIQQPSADGGLKLDRYGYGRLWLEDYSLEVDVHHVDAASRSARIDVTYGLLTRPQPRFAIYRLDRDRLLLCLGSREEPPTDFSTKPGDGRQLLSFKRKK